MILGAALCGRSRRRAAKGELVPDSGALPKLRLQGPVRFLNVGPTNRIIVEEAQCQNPTDDLVFAIGQVVDYVAPIL